MLGRWALACSISSAVALAWRDSWVAGSVTPTSSRERCRAIRRPSAEGITLAIVLPLPGGPGMLFWSLQLTANRLQWIDDLAQDGRLGFRLPESRRREAFVQTLRHQVRFRAAPPSRPGHHPLGGPAPLALGYYQGA